MPKDQIAVTGSVSEVNIEVIYSFKVEIPNKHIELFMRLQKLFGFNRVLAKTGREHSKIYLVDTVDMMEREHAIFTIESYCKKHELKLNITPD